MVQFSFVKKANLDFDNLHKMRSRTIFYNDTARSYDFFKELKRIDKSMKMCTASMHEWLEPPGTPTEVMGIHQLCREGQLGLWTANHLTVM